MFSIKNDNCIFENIDTVIFDKDGTFIDSHLYWGQIIRRRSSSIIDFYALPENCFDEICLSMGFDTTGNILTPQGPIALVPRSDVTVSVQKMLEKFKIDAQKCDIERIFDNVHSEFRSTVEDGTCSHVKILDGARELFRTLKKNNAKLAVITADSNKNTQKILEYLDIKEYFNLVMGKDDCEEPKRTGKPALLALEALNSKPENTIVIGDSKMDSDLAKNAALKGSIMVSTGQTPFETLLSYSDFVVKSLRELEIK